MFVCACARTHIKCNQLLFHKSFQVIQWGNSFQKNPAGTINYPYAKWCTWTPYVKIYLSWILDLKVEVKTIRLLEQSIGVHVHDLEVHNNFLDRTQKVLATKKRLMN